MIEPFDTAALPKAAQRILDPASPAPLRAMGARGIVPGLPSADIFTVVTLLCHDVSGDIAALARKFIVEMPAPLLAGALSADLHPAVLDLSADFFMGRADVVEKLLGMPRMPVETVERLARTCGELVAELIATNERRMLEHPPIIERLYMNKATRMSTADRIIELAVRNHLELSGIPAYREVAIAIGQELIAEQSTDPTPDDLLFRDTLREGERVSFDPTKEDTHEISDEGEEAVSTKLLPLYARLAQMTIAQKIRAAMLGNAAERMLLMRDSNRLVASAAIRSPLIQEPEVVRVSASRVVSEEVLRAISLNKDWVKNYMVKLNLVSNPRTPFPIASRLIPHLREHELKTIAKSKNVSAPIAISAKQQLSRKKT